MSQLRGREFKIQPINTLMRDVLIKHMDTPVSINRRGDDYKTILAAVQRGWLCYGIFGSDGRKNAQVVFRPRITYITDEGRAALAAALADWADAMMTANFDRRRRAF